MSFYIIVLFTLLFNCQPFLVQFVFLAAHELSPIFFNKHTVLVTEKNNNYAK